MSKSQAFLVWIGLVAPQELKSECKSNNYNKVPYVFIAEIFMAHLNVQNTVMMHIIMGTIIYNILGVL